MVGSVSFIQYSVSDTDSERFTKECARRGLLLLSSVSYRIQIRVLFGLDKFSPDNPSLQKTGSMFHPTLQTRILSFWTGALLASDSHFCKCSFGPGLWQRPATFCAMFASQLVALLMFHIIFECHSCQLLAVGSVLSVSWTQRSAALSESEGPSMNKNQDLKISSESDKRE